MDFPCCSHIVLGLLIRNPDRNLFLIYMMFQDVLMKLFMFTLAILLSRSAKEQEKRFICVLRSRLFRRNSKWNQAIKSKNSDLLAFTFVRFFARSLNTGLKPPIKSTSFVTR